MFISLTELFRKSVLFFANFYVFNSTFRSCLIHKLIKNYSCKGSYIRKNVTLFGNGLLHIGNNTMINEECFLDCSGELIIGKNISMGIRTIILTSTHKIGSPIRCFDAKRKKTIIGDNVWIGANVLVYPGVVINEGCVIAAGEVVRENVASNLLLKNGRLEKIDISAQHRELREQSISQ
jgi:acetyltransferase-like isoleucine patch superfamily enzyme